jgi:hypothetical protein
MKVTILIAIILLGLPLGVEPQKKKLGKPRDLVRIVKNKPSVYLSFERRGRRNPLEMGESSEGIWLRLHNNTKWKIAFPAFDVPDDLGDVGMYYVVERATKGKSIDQFNEESELPVGYSLSDIYSTMWLSSGDSILFSLPQEHLAVGLAIHISFSYEWEDQDDVFAGREPSHHVYFHSSALPPKPLPRGK